MPCRVEQWELEAIEKERQEALHNGELSELFCSVMQLVEENAAIFSSVSPDVLIWWAEHKKRDRTRVHAEIARKKTEDDKEAALAKLTPYERRLLRV